MKKILLDIVIRYIIIRFVINYVDRHKKDWQFSTIHRFIAQGIYPSNWGVDNIPQIPQEIVNE